MSYQLKEETRLALVALKVKDIDKEVAFFKSVLGLDVMREENGMAFLGIKEAKRTFICLLEKEDGVPSEISHNGLYHLGILLPERRDLSALYQHLLSLDYPIIGMSDLGHSEVIYLKDPEFNGIKLSWDKPKEQWNYHTEGTMDSILSRLDTQSLLAEDTDGFSKLPLETCLGHVHLNVVDLEESQQFYTEVLGFKLTSAAFPSLRYLAAGDYHHHLAINTLNQIKAEDQDDENLGLDYLSFKVATETELIALQEHLTRLNRHFFYNKGKQILEIDDPNGVHVWFHVNDVKK